MKDIEALKSLGRMESCVVGKAIYENKISIEDIKDWNLKALISL
jgi:phosphoribosylformimino-5-aminoimidazole carboxamide ribotide isomerase